MNDKIDLTNMIVLNSEELGLKILTKTNLTIRIFIWGTDLMRNGIEKCSQETELGAR